MNDVINKNVLYHLNRIDNLSKIIIYSDGSGKVQNGNNKTVFYFTNLVELINSLKTKNGKYPSHYSQDKKHGAE